MSNSITFNDSEFLLLYMAVGSCFAEIKEYTSSYDLDVAPLNVQELALQNEEAMEKLYAKMREHIKYRYPMADLFFQSDTQKPRPNKNAQFQGK